MTGMPTRTVPKPHDRVHLDLAALPGQRSVTPGWLRRYGPTRYGKPGAALPYWV